MRLRPLIAAMATLALVLTAPAAALAVTFGADLSQAPDNTATCDTGGFSAASCAFYSGATGPSFFVPESGRITAIRVRTGPGPQGPMRLVVMSQLLQNQPGKPGHPYTACCFVAAYGPVFIPARDAISRVPMSVPAIAQPAPAPDDYSTVARGDFLALEVLEPGVAIPAVTESGSLWNVFAPAPDPSTAPAPGQSPYPAQRDNGGFGFHLSLSAELTPDPGTTEVTPPAGALTPTPSRVARPTLTVPGTRRLSVRRNAVAVPVICSVRAACTGRLALQSTPVGRAARTARATTFGTARFSFAAGRHGTVRIVLSSAGRSAVRRHRTLSAFANVAFTRGHGVPVSVAITLRR